MPSMFAITWFKSSTVGSRILLPAERQKLASETGGPSSGFLDDGDAFQRFFQWSTLGAARHLTDELEVSRDNCQQIVEIVRDTACELADCFHLLGLGQLGPCSLFLFFCPITFRDVPDESSKLTARGRCTPSADFNVNETPVLYDGAWSRSGPCLCRSLCRWAVVSAPRFYRFQVRYAQSKKFLTRCSRSFGNKLR